VRYATLEKISISIFITLARINCSYRRTPFNIASNNSDRVNSPLDPARMCMRVLTRENVCKRAGSSHGVRNRRKGEKPPAIGPSSTLPLAPRLSALPLYLLYLRLPIKTVSRAAFSLFLPRRGRPARPFIFQDFPLMPEGSEKEGLERAFPSFSGHSTTKIS